MKSVGWIAVVVALWALLGCDNEASEEALTVIDSLEDLDLYTDPLEIQ